MLIRCIDFETTGFPDETDRHALVEVGFTDLDLDLFNGARVGMPCAQLVNPGRLIPIEAMAVHHIRDQHVADAPSPDRVLPTLMERAEAFAAHVTDFERKFFAGGDRKWICTHKCALRIWPDAPSHSNQALRYFLRFDDMADFDAAAAMPPHRAGPDSYVTAFLLRELLKHKAADTLVHWSSGPALLARVTFGKHAGMRWCDVPKDYLSWIVNKSDMDDRDVRATAKYYLRGGKPLTSPLVDAAAHSDPIRSETNKDV